jgi:rare lipoprotein A
MKLFLAILLTAYTPFSAAYGFHRRQNREHRVAPPRVQYGVASWYRTQGRVHLTASGEYFKESGLTAAHRTLPFGTKVKVTNLTNGRSVVVRINDRGPAIRGRLIDLSKAAAERLGFGRRGLASVRVAVVGLPLGAGS